MLDFLKDYINDLLVAICLFFPLAVLAGIAFLVLWLIQKIRKRNETAGNIVTITLIVMVGCLILLTPLIILFVVLKDMP